MDTFSVFLNGKQTCIETSNTTLRYTLQSNSECIATNNILRTELHLGSEDSGTVVLHYLDYNGGRRTKLSKHTFSGDREECGKLHKALQTLISGLRRPKKLMFFVNPNSGHKKAMKTYRKYAEPLFTLCGIDSDVRKTEYPKQATEILLSCDLQGVDGVVAVGGDGILNEVITGLLLRTQVERHMDYDNPDNEMIAARIPVGIIPAGSGNVTAQYLNNSKCPLAAAAAILKGQTLPTNIASVHVSGQLKATAALILGFGLFGDMMKDCEKHRSMGPSRYNVIPLMTLMRRRPIDVEVDYVPAGQEERKPPMGILQRQVSCPISRLQDTRQLKRAKSTSDVLGNQDTKKTEGCVFAIDTHPIMMKPKDNKLAPFFGEDYLRVYLTEKCGLFKHMAQLAKVKEWEVDCYKAKFVKEIHARQFRVRIPNAALTKDDNGETCLGKDYYINCDGEVVRLNKPQFDVKLHRRVVSLFGQKC